MARTNRCENRVVFDPAACEYRVVNDPAACEYKVVFDLKVAFGPKEILAVSDLVTILSAKSAWMTVAHKRSSAAAMLMKSLVIQMVWLLTCKCQPTAKRTKE